MKSSNPLRVFLSCVVVASDDDGGDHRYKEEEDEISVTQRKNMINIHEYHEYIFDAPSQYIHFS